MMTDKHTWAKVHKLDCTTYMIWLKLKKKKKCI